MRRNMVWLMSLLFLAVFAIPLAADQPRLQTMPRIGFLADGSRSSHTAWIEGFRRGLRELGYEEGRSIAIEWLYGEGKTERFPALVTELTQRNVAVIVVGGATATRAAKQNGTPIPVVMVNVTDPVRLGLVASLARPGANITGVSNLAPELGRKRLELLKEVVPGLARVAVLGDPSSPSHSPGWRETKRAAESLGVQVHSVEVREPNPDFPGAFAAITRHRADALITLSQPLILVHRKRIVPGGNITGWTHQGLELRAKYLELLKEAVPAATRFGVLWNPTNHVHKPSLTVIEDAGKRLKVQLHLAGIQDPRELDGAFTALVRKGVQALVVFPDGMFLAQRRLISALAAGHRLPTIYGLREYAEVGGLMTYGTNMAEMHRQLGASFVDRILKGANPANLPVAQPTRFELLINLKTAKALGLTIPPSLLLRADRVIE